MPDNKMSGNNLNPQQKTKEVFYRKYRFSSFDNIFGQESVASFFINTIKYNKISHAYLFAGPRGTGKTSMARLFAKTINCLEKTSINPCGKCKNCIEFEKGSSLDVVELDAASNRKIDDIRALRDDVSFMPINGKYKIFILDEAHMLTNEAANAFLKTLEEPPPYVIFILATTELHKIPPTILSRCQLVKFSRIDPKDIVKNLEYVINQENLEKNENEKIKFENYALFLIAKKANGGMRDALSLLEYILSFNNNITVELVEKILGIPPIKQIIQFISSITSNSIENGLTIIKNIYSAGNDLTNFLETINSCLISMILLKLDISNTKLIEYDNDDLLLINEVISKTNLNQLIKMLENFSHCLSQIRIVPDPLLHLEYVYVKTKLDIESNKQNISNLNNQIDNNISLELINNLIENKLNNLIKNLKLPATSINENNKNIDQQIKTDNKDSKTSENVDNIKSQNNNLTLEKIKSFWNSSFLNKVKELSIPTYALLSLGIPINFKNNTLELDFTKNKFCGERLNSSNHIKVIQKAFFEIFNVNINIKIICSNNQTNTTKDDKQIIEQFKNDPIIKKLVSEFDGEVISVN